MCVCVCVCKVVHYCCVHRHCYVHLYPSTSLRAGPNTLVRPMSSIFVLFIYFSLIQMIISSGHYEIKIKRRLVFPHSHSRSTTRRLLSYHIANRWGEVKSIWIFIRWGDKIYGKSKIFEFIAFFKSVLALFTKPKEVCKNCHKSEIDYIQLCIIPIWSLAVESGSLGSSFRRWLLLPVHRITKMHCSPSAYRWPHGILGKAFWFPWTRKHSPTQCLRSLFSIVPDHGVYASCSRIGWFAARMHFTFSFIPFRWVQAISLGKLKQKPSPDEHRGYSHFHRCPDK